MTGETKSPKLRLFFVTGNRSKFLEAASVLELAGVRLVQEDIELDESGLDDQAAVVVAKAKHAYEKLKQPVMVDDTGMYFHAFDNFPGAYTKRLLKHVGYDGVMRLLDGKDRKAHFRCLVCFNDGSKCQVFSGELHGEITKTVSGKINSDWEYDSIFIPEGLSVPLSELTIEERAKFSHRKKAVMKLLEHLKNS